MINSSNRFANRAIEDAIRIANEAPSEETVSAFISVLHDHMVAGEHFLVPVIVERGDDGEYSFCSVQSEDKNCLICFTNEAEANKAEMEALRRMTIESFFNAARNLTNINGVVINPFGDNSIPYFKFISTYGKNRRFVEGINKSPVFSTLFIIQNSMRFSFNFLPSALPNTAPDNFRSLCRHIRDTRSGISVLFENI